LVLPAVGLAAVGFSGGWLIERLVNRAVGFSGGWFSGGWFSGGWFSGGWF